MAEFLNMDGHGPYIWTGYIVTAFVLGGLAVARYREYAKLKDGAASPRKGGGLGPAKPHDTDGAQNDL